MLVPVAGVLSLALVLVMVVVALLPGGPRFEAAESLRLLMLAAWAPVMVLVAWAFAPDSTVDEDIQGYRPSCVTGCR